MRQTDNPHLAVEQAAAQIKELAELLKERRGVKASLLSWAKFVLKPLGMRPALHHVALIQLLEKVCDGRIKRLIVMMPPGAAKSSYVSQIFPPYWMLHHPNSRIIAGSNTERLSTNFSRIVRGYTIEHARMLGFSLDPAQSNVQEWASTNGCQYLAVGSEGSVLGNRADLLIVDDPYKSRADAASDVRRDAIWQWYSSDLMSRLKPDGRIIIVQTRFHTDDLVGRLLETEPDNWHVVKFTAVCESPADDPLGRKLGELLWPEYQTLEFYDEKRRLGGEQDWASNYQQMPVPAGGTIFNGKVLEAQRLQMPPEGITQTVRAWDLASAVVGDWTVGLKLARLEDGRFCVLDVVRERGDPSYVENLIRDVAKLDGRGTKIGLAIDPGQAGLSQTAYLTRSLAGFNVISSRETGSKLVRATPVASQVNSGNVSYVNGYWNRAFLDEVSNFPSSRYDDQVDSLSRAFGVVSAPVAPAYVAHLDWMLR